MTSAYPSSIDTSATFPSTIAPTTPQSGPSHSSLHNDVSAVVLAIETLLGINGANFLTVGTAQTITGAKTFNRGALMDAGNIVFMAEKYGAVGNDLASNDAALALIDAAIGAVNIAPGVGAVVRFGPGIFRFSTYAWVNSVTLEGHGPFQTYLRTTAATGDAMTFKGSSTIRDIGFSATNSTSRTAGSLIKCPNSPGGNTLISNVYLANYFRGIDTGTGSQVALENVFFNTPGTGTANGAAIYAPGTYALHLTNVISNAGAHTTHRGIDFAGGGGDTIIVGSQFLLGKYGLFNGVTSGTVGVVIISDSQFDTCITNGIYWKPNGGNADELRIVNSRISSTSAGAGMIVGNDGAGTMSYGVSFDNLSIVASSSHGLHLTTGAPPVTGTVQLWANLGRGLHVDANVNDFAIAGRAVGNAGDQWDIANGTSTRYGVALELAAGGTYTNGATNGAGHVRDATLQQIASITAKLRLGVLSSNQYYDIVREVAAGKLQFTGAQSNFSGYDFIQNLGGVSTTTFALAPITGIAAFSADVTLAAASLIYMAGQNRLRYKNSMVRAKSNATQAFGAGAWTALVMGAEDFDTDGLHSTASNTSRLTAAIAGKYKVVGGAYFEGTLGTTTQIGVSIGKNGATPIDGTRVQITPFVGFAAGNGQGIGTSCIVDLAAGDYVQLLGIHVGSAGNLDTGNTTPSAIEMCYVGE